MGFRHIRFVRGQTSGYKSGYKNDPVGWKPHGCWMFKGTYRKGLLFHVGHLI